MTDFRTWHWSKDEPYKVRNSELIGFLSWSGRYTSCPVCPHSGNWTFHIDEDPGMTGPDPYMTIYVMGSHSPLDLEKTKARLGFFIMECPRCAHTEMIPCPAVAAYMEGNLGASPNGSE